MNKLLHNIKALKVSNPEGFTVYLPDLTPVMKGWVVALEETQNSFGDEGLKKVLEVAMRETKIIGGWQSDKKWYWDAVVVFSDEEAATKFGIENNQIGIYNIETSYFKELIY